MKERFKLVLKVGILLAVGLFIAFLFEPFLQGVNKAELGEIASAEVVAYVINTFWYLTFSFIKLRGAKECELD